MGVVQVNDCMLWGGLVRGGENGRKGTDSMRAFRTYLWIIK